MSTATDTTADVRNVIVIGSGPAGYTAALYTARASLKPLVFEGAVTAGGALVQTTEVENFPGFRDGIMGPDLMDNMRAQADRFGAELVPDDIVEVDLTGTVKTVTDSAGTVHRAKAVIVATGSQHRMLGLPGEDALSGRGVSYCATCDGFFFREHDILVVGGGDTAMEEATFLSRFAKSVTIVHRRDTLRASKTMQDRALADPKISFAWNSEVAEIREDGGKLAGLVLRDTVTGKTSELPATGLFVGGVSLAADSAEGEFTEGVADLGEGLAVAGVVELVGQQYGPAPLVGRDPHAGSGEAVVHPDILGRLGTRSWVPEQAA